MSTYDDLRMILKKLSAADQAIVAAAAEELLQAKAQHLVVPMRRVIIESPYAGPTPESIEANIAYAKRACMDSLKRGESPLASHLLWTQDGLLLDALASERRLGIDAGHAWLGVAQLVIFYMDRGESPGMKHARVRAAASHVPTEDRFIG